VTEWSGGLYVSPSMAGSRLSGLIAGAMSLGENGMSLPILKILMHLFYKSFVLEKHAFKYDAWCISSLFTTHKSRCHSLPLKEFELSRNFCLKYDFSAEWRDFD
jgi:hypothetical protein